MSDVFDPGEPTRSLGLALAIAAKIGRLGPHLHEDAIRAACGTDRELEREVRSLLLAAEEPEPTTVRFDPVHDEPFGNYVLHDRVGAGSMGVVYRATQIDTRRIVALKRLRPGDASDAMLRRFHREGVLLARLQHHGIVQILDAGHVATAQGSEPYLAMEFVEGPSLLAGAEQWDLNCRARVTLLAQLCRAIAYAHRRGVIHRDLKPDNVRIEVDRNQGTMAPRVLDFGVAAAVTPNSREATMAQHIVGTLGHIAPEQIDGEVDVRCDIYSLGVIGYELLTGRRPIDVRGLGVLTAIARIRDARPVLAGHYDPRLRGDLEAILAKAIAPRPEDRYASADEFGKDLDNWLHLRPVDARHKTPLYLFSRLIRRRRKMALAVVALLITIGLSIRMTVDGLAEARTANAALVNVLASTVQELDGEVNGRARPARLPEHLRAAIEELAAQLPDELGVRSAQAEFLQVDSQLARSHGQAQNALQVRLALLDVRKQIAANHPSAEATRKLALAYVLVGDMQKEIALSRQQSTAAARESYREADPLYRRLHDADPTARQPADDLAHNVLRFAALDLLDGAAESGEQHIREAKVLVDRLSRDYSDDPNTFSVLREFTGVCSALAELRGNRSEALVMLDRMLENTETAHRLRPQDLHFAEFVLATAYSCANASYRAELPEKAKQQLHHTDAVVEMLATRAPDNIQVIEQRMLIAMMWAQFAQRDGDHVVALQHLNAAVDLGLRLREADDLSTMHFRCRTLGGLVAVTLAHLESLRDTNREHAIASCRMLMQPLATVVHLFPEDHDMRATLLQLEVSVGNAAELGAVQREIATARRDGWYNQRCWLVEAQLLRREGSIAAARQKLEQSPRDLPEDLALAVAQERLLLSRQ